MDFDELQATAKSGGCFIVIKGGEYLLYRQMPTGVTNQLIGKRSRFSDMVSLTRRAVLRLNAALRSVG